MRRPYADGRLCFRERDVFLKDTAPHNTWRFYMEQTSDRVLAYAIELTGTERGKIKGNLYELDYAKHYERVKEILYWNVTSAPVGPKLNPCVALAALRRPASFYKQMPFPMAGRAHAGGCCPP